MYGQPRPAIVEFLEKQIALEEQWLDRRAARQNAAAPVVDIETYRRSLAAQRAILLENPPTPEFATEHNLADEDATEVLVGWRGTSRPAARSSRRVVRR